MRRDESQPEQETGPMKQKTKVFLGMDVHKDSVMIAVILKQKCPTSLKQKCHTPEFVSSR